MNKQREMKRWKLKVFESFDIVAKIQMKTSTELAFQILGNKQNQKLPRTEILRRNSENPSKETELKKKYIYKYKVLTKGYKPEKK